MLSRGEIILSRPSRCGALGVAVGEIETVRGGVEDAAIIVFVVSRLQLVNSKMNNANTISIWRNFLMAITVINTFADMIINPDQITINLSG